MIIITHRKYSNELNIAIMTKILNMNQNEISKLNHQKFMRHKMRWNDRKCSSNIYKAYIYLYIYTQECAYMDRYICIIFSLHPSQGKLNYGIIIVIMTKKKTKLKEKGACFIHQVKTVSCMFMLADVRMMVWISV